MSKPPEPILSPKYWRDRLAVQGRDERHRSIFITPKENWDAIATRHRELLADLIKPNESVLDAGCGWGRLLELMPNDWRGDYLGVDLSPDLIDLARKENPTHSFIVADLRKIPAHSQTFNVAVLISIRPMIKRNLSEDFWNEVETELRRVAKRLLFLEYDVLDNGSME